MRAISPSGQIPELMSKRYLTMREVSKFCSLKPHVLRYWEQEFAQLQPIKRRGNRRYYQRKDVDLILQIKTLLYDEGYTIMGARNRLSQSSSQSAFKYSALVTSQGESPDERRQIGSSSAGESKLVEYLVRELKAVRLLLS